MRVTYFTLEERKIIESGCKRGYSYDKINELLPHRSRSGIINEIIRKGRRSGYNAEVAHEESQKKIKERTRKIKNAGWLINFKSDIENYVKSGMPPVEIITKIGCGYKALRAFMMRHNIKYEPTSSIGVVERIEAIEMQLEIILETLEKLRK